MLKVMGLSPAGQAPAVRCPTRTCLLSTCVLWLAGSSPTPSPSPHHPCPSQDLFAAF